VKAGGCPRGGGDGDTWRLSTVAFQKEVRELTSQVCFCWFAIYLLRARDETEGASVEPTAVLV
jgi:hypothetical protein